MKKGIALVLSLCMLVAVFAVAGCRKAEPVYKFGVGAVNSIASSRDASENATARAQGDTTVAAVVFDKNGKIVAVSIDTAQVQVNFDENMAVTNRDAELLTKKEKKYDYNMKRVSEIDKERFEQIAALEEWMVGKTVDEVLNMKVKQRDENHTHVPDVPELESSVTITVEDYLAAVEKAWKNAVEFTGYDKMGLGFDISIASSRDASDTATAQAQIDTTFVGTVFNAEGKVAAVSIDTAQIRIPYDAEGKVAADRNAEVQTKKERKYDYNMKRVSEIDKEWFEQIAALEEWMIGKTVNEVTGMKVKQRDENHTHVPDVPELESSVTITVESYLAAFKQSHENAR